MVNTLEKNIAEIIHSDLRTAEVFSMYNINIGFEGNLTLESACKMGQINKEALLTDLEIATRNVTLPNDIQFDEWKIDFLVDYIVHIHHAYLYKSLTKIDAYLHAAISVDKHKSRNTSQITLVFSELANLLIQHNKQEEAVIFPYIKQLEVASKHQATYGSLFVRTLRKPLSLVEKEHAEINILLQRLQSATRQFALDDTASIQYRILVFKLQELYKDLLQHHYLEENFLYPKAIATEQLLLMNESS